MSHQGSIPAAQPQQFHKGQKVRINSAAYRTWYEENQPCGVWLLDDDDTGSVRHEPTEAGFVDIHHPHGWVARIPVEFVEVIA